MPPRGRSVIEGQSLIESGSRISNSTRRAIVASSRINSVSANRGRCRSARPGAEGKVRPAGPPLRVGVEPSLRNEALRLIEVPPVAVQGPLAEEHEHARGHPISAERCVSAGLATEDPSRWEQAHRFKDDRTGERQVAEVVARRIPAAQHGVEFRAEPVPGLWMGVEQVERPAQPQRGRVVATDEEVDEFVAQLAIAQRAWPSVSAWSLASSSRASRSPWGSSLRRRSAMSRWSCASSHAIVRK